MNNTLGFPFATNLEKPGAPILLSMLNALNQLRTVCLFYKVKRVKPSFREIVMEELSISESKAKSLVGCNQA